MHRTPRITAAPAVDQAALAAELVEATSRDELTVEYQPIVALPSEQLIAFEALVRWQHPTLGTLLAEQFVTLAEQVGAIERVGAWILHRACTQLASWSSWFPDLPIGMAVNVSPRQLRDPGFVPTVQRVLAATGIAPARLSLEVTDDATMSDLSCTARLFAAVRATGVRLAVDDFGVRRASLALLHMVRPDLLKLDGSFVAGLDRDPVDTAIATAMLTMAHDLGMAVVAEQVETTTQRDALSRLHCPFAQGFVWSPPLSPEAATDLLVTQGAADRRWTSPWTISLESPNPASHATSTTGSATLGAVAAGTAAAAHGGHGQQAAGSSGSAGAGTSPVAGVSLAPAVESDEVSALMSFLTHEMRSPLQALMASAGHLQVLLGHGTLSPARHDDGAPAGGPAPRQRSAPQGRAAPRQRLASVHTSAHADRWDLPIDHRAAALDAADTVERQAAHLAHLVAALRDARLIGQGQLRIEPRPTDIGELIRTVTTDASDDLGDHPVHLHLRPVPTTPLDPPRITQVLVNVLSNAAKFSPPGAPIDVAAWADDEGAHISVVDRGPGIPIERSRDAFRRFATLDHQRKGLGLGLYLARGIAVTHGGDLRQRRAATGGAEFILTLPLTGTTGAFERRDPANAGAEWAVSHRRRPTGADGHTFAGHEIGRDRPPVPEVGPPLRPPSTPRDPSTCDARTSDHRAASATPLSTRAASATPLSTRAPSTTPLSTRAPSATPLSAAVGDGGRGTLLDGVVGNDTEALRALWSAYRSLLLTTSVEEVVATSIDLVRALGGRIVVGVPTHDTRDHVIPLDVSCGRWPATFAVCDPFSVARMRLEAVLPLYGADASDQAARCRTMGRQGALPSDASLGSPATPDADLAVPVGDVRALATSAPGDVLLAVRVEACEVTVRGVARMLRSWFGPLTVALGADPSTAPTGFERPALADRQFEPAPSGDRSSPRDRSCAAVLLALGDAPLVADAVDRLPALAGSAGAPGRAPGGAPGAGTIVMATAPVAVAHDAPAEDRLQAVERALATCCRALGGLHDDHTPPPGPRDRTELRGRSRAGGRMRPPDGSGRPAAT
jgi:EAL domain-containing protein (putative c-di-GMP-specific phosphodiesterase class I)